MEFESSKVLLAVLDCGTVQGAAEQLEVSRGTVRGRLRELEESVGASLVDRGLRGVEGTALVNRYHGYDARWDE